MVEGSFPPLAFDRTAKGAAVLLRRVISLEAVDRRWVEMVAVVLGSVLLNAKDVAFGLDFMADVERDGRRRSSWCSTSFNLWVLVGGD